MVLNFFYRTSRQEGSLAEMPLLERVPSTVTMCAGISSGLSGSDFLSQGCRWILRHAKRIYSSMRVVRLDAGKKKR
jgi:hypothetical protein